MEKSKILKIQKNHFQNIQISFSQKLAEEPFHNSRVYTYIRHSIYIQILRKICRRETKIERVHIPLLHSIFQNNSNSGNELDITGNGFVCFIYYPSHSIKSGGDFKRSKGEKGIMESKETYDQNHGIQD